MQQADDMAEITRLVGMIRDRVVDELRWEAEKMADKLVGDFKEAYRLRRQADRFEVMCV
jgi:hypothetical protein